MRLKEALLSVVSPNLPGALILQPLPDAASAPSLRFSGSGAAQSDPPRPLPQKLERVSFD